MIWLRSGWFVVLWMLSAAVVAATYAARVFASRQQRDRALGLVIGAHLAASMPTVAILPEGAAPVALLLVGDVVLAAAFVRRRQLHRYIVAAMIATAGVGLLSLQSWTGLGQHLPHRVLVGVLALHVLGTGALASSGARSSHRGLLDTTAALSGAQERRRDVVTEQRARIERAITAGPAATLRSLTARLGDIDAALGSGDTADIARARASAMEGADDAQHALTVLRGLSHGIFPDTLHRQGLEAGLRSLARSTPSLVAVSVQGVVDQRAASAIYFTVAELLDAHADIADISWTLRVASDEARCSFELAAHDVPGGLRTVPAEVLDRLGALHAEVSLQDEPGRWKLAGHLPQGPAGRSDTTEHDEATLAASTPDRSDGGALHRFTNVSLLMCSGGVVFLAAVYAATNIRSLALLAIALCGALGLLGLAWISLRADLVHAAVAAVCAETLGAGLVVSALLPSFLPVTLLISVMPMMLALPYLGRRATTVIASVQTAGGAAVTVLALNGGVDGLVDPVPAVLEAISLATACAAITLLVALTASATNSRLIDRAEALRSSLASVVADADAERHRIERDLHDGAQQHLVAIALQLRVVAQLAERDPRRARNLAEQIHEQSCDARADLSALVTGIGMANIKTRGLLDALRAAVGRLGRPVRVHGTSTALSESVATTAYFCCIEAVQNALKHAGPDASIDVRLRDLAGSLHFDVRDDGVGFDPTKAESGRGLLNIVERCELIGGTARVESSPGAGTTLRARLPLL